MFIIFTLINYLLDGAPHIEFGFNPVLMAFVIALLADVFLV